MKIKRTVTDKKLAANRLNAKLSTGPRTEQGKDNVRFNAVILGLFAKHTVITHLDDAGPGDFADLVASLVNDLRPIGTFEEFWVLEIATAMWKVRRAALVEKSSARYEALWQNDIPDVAVRVRAVQATQLILKNTDDEIAATGGLSLSSYDAVAPILAGVFPEVVLPKRLVQSNSSNSGAVTNLVLVDQHSLAMLKATRESFEKRFEMLVDNSEQQCQAYAQSHAIPSERVLDKILRYDKAAHKKLDRAYKQLAELQAARKKPRK